MYAFDYHRPQSVAEAAKLLGSAKDTKLLAGGHTLIPTMKQRLASPRKSSSTCRASPSCAASTRKAARWSSAP